MVRLKFNEFQVFLIFWMKIWIIIKLKTIYCTVKLIIIKCIGKRMPTQNINTIDIRYEIIICKRNSWLILLYYSFSRWIFQSLGRNKCVLWKYLFMAMERLSEFHIPIYIFFIHTLQQRRIYVYLVSYYENLDITCI